MLDELMERMLEGAGRQLSFEVDGQEAGGRIDMFEPRHGRIPFRSDCLRSDRGEFPKFRPTTQEQHFSTASLGPTEEL